MTFAFPTQVHQGSNAVSAVTLQKVVGNATAFGTSRMRCVVRAALLLAAASVAAASASPQSAAVSGSSPLLLWSSIPEGLSAVGVQGSEVNYESVTFSSVVPQLLSRLTRSKTSTANTPDADQQQPDTLPQMLVLFAGPEVSTAQLANSGANFQHLEAAVKSGASALSFPNVAHTSPDLEGSLEAAVQSLQLSEAIHQLGACGGSAGNAAQLTLPDAAAEQDQQVVLVCGPQQDVAGSMQLLSKVIGLLEQSGRSHATLFAGRPQGQLEGQHGRALLAETPLRSLLDFPPDSICNAKCRSQVQIFEGIILAVTLLSSLTIGMCCMNMLGTPTKFETPKDASRQE